MINRDGREVYDSRGLRDRAKLINIIKSGRSDGKSTEFLRLGITDFFRFGKKFMWVRRYKDDLTKQLKNEFFNNLYSIASNPDVVMPEYERKLYSTMHAEIGAGNKIIINDRIVGDLVALNTSHKLKSIPFPDTDTIIYDEYIIKRDSSQRYIPDEVSIFLDLIFTVFRERTNCHAYLVGNNYSWLDPFCLAFGIKPTRKRYTLYTNPYNGTKNVCLEMYHSDKFHADMLQTAQGQLVEGTRFGDYAISNEAYEDSDEFISEPPKGTHLSFRCGIRYDGKTYGFYLDDKNGYLYMRDKYDATSRMIYALERDDHTLNTFLITNARYNYAMREIVKFYRSGSLRFADLKTKQAGLDILSYLT